MATRRIKPTINCPYIQPLKLGTDRKLVVAPSAVYNSILFTKKHKSGSDKEIKILQWAKFDANNFDGIFVFASLLKNSKNISGANCNFSIYSVALDGTWAETFVVSKSGTLSGDKYIAHITQSDLDPLELDGERTFAIEVSISRLGKTYTNKIYINHLGIYENVLRLRQDVEFLDITKVDE